MNSQKENSDKLRNSIQDLKHALEFLEKGKKDHFYLAGIAKTFEICFEYAWKSLKRRVTAEGIEVYSPKEVIKQAGRLGFLENVERWLDFLEDRNLAVHDYLGVSSEEYLKTIQTFLSEVKKMVL